MSQLLPFVIPGLKGKSPAEYQLATYMLLMRLITRCKPALQLFNGVQVCAALCADLVTTLVLQP